MQKILKIITEELKTNYSTYIYVYLMFTAIIFVVNYKIQSTSRSSFSDIFYLYSILTLSVTLVKYVGSIFHPTNRWAKYRPYKWPEIDVIIPGYNEGVAVYETVKSVVKANYPKDRMKIVLIDDGSSDDTWRHMRRAKKDFPNQNIVAIKFKKNKGEKRSHGCWF